MKELSNYHILLQTIKSTIQQSQQLTYRKINTQLIETYFHIGKTITKQKDQEGRGTKVITQLSHDLIQEFGNHNGYSTRNLSYMMKFYETYSHSEILQQLVAQLPRGQNIAIMDKCETIEQREFYIKLCIDKGLSRNVLIHQIEGDAYTISQQQGTNNFITTIPQDSDLINTIVKDEYILNFLGLEESFAEKQLEQSLINNIKQFILELGSDFCFMGNQYKLSLEDKDYFIDLLFYHRELKRLFAIELKVEEFKPEFIGKMNFYLELLDQTIKRSDEEKSIGIILCKNKNKLTVEYALRDTTKPIAVTTYQIISKLEDKLKTL